MKKPPYWMARLCKLADAVDAAEIRRASAEAELARADGDLEAAFSALYAFYTRLPYQIELTRGSMEKVERLASAWLKHLDRRDAKRSPSLFHAYLNNKEAGSPD